MIRVSTKVLAAVFAALATLAASHAGATIVVPTQQPTIQAAINAAQPGEHIIVLPGTYPEGAINVTTPVVIDGPNVGVTPSQVRGPEARVVGGFVIMADGVSIRGFEIVDYVLGGITRRAISGLQALDEIVVSYNWMHAPTSAVFITAVELGDNSGVARSDRWRIVANTIDGQLPGSCSGVFVQSADNVTIVGNKIVLLTTPTVNGDFGLPAIVLESVHEAVVGKNELDCGQSNSNIGSLAYCVGVQSFYDASVNVRISDNRMTNCIEGVQSTGAEFPVRQLSIIRNDIDATIFGIGLQMSISGFSGPNRVSHDGVAINNNDIAAGLGCVRVVVVGIASASVSDLVLRNNCFEAQAGASGVFGVAVNSLVDIPTFGGSIDARRNYWGAANGPSTVGLGSGLKVTTRVVFSPWLDSCPH